MREKEIMGDAEGSDLWSQRETRKAERRAHRGLHKKNASLKSLTRKMREVDFPEFLQPMELKDWSLRGRQHCCM